jgi:hypothetical protein
LELCRYFGGEGGVLYALFSLCQLQNSGTLPAPGFSFEAVQRSRMSRRLVRSRDAAQFTAEQLRELAARLLALAMEAQDKDLLERLCVRAGEYLDQAGLLEPDKLPSLRKGPLSGNP